MATTPTWTATGNGLTMDSRRTGRGFTLIEMMVVITILAMLAALVMPRVAAVKQSSDFRVREEAIRRFPSQALAAARESRATVTLRVDGSDLILERPSADDAGNAEEIRRTSLGSFAVSGATQSGESTDAASFEWKVYPDGTAEAATLEINEGSGSRTLQLTPEGDAFWLAPGAAERSSEKWSAGEREQRTQ